MTVGEVIRARVYSPDGDGMIPISLSFEDPGEIY